MAAFRLGAMEPRRSAMARATGRLAGRTVLVNNASELGPTPMPYLIDTDPDALRRVLEVNLLGPFLLTRALLGPMLAAGSGSVINLSSDAGVVGYPGSGPASWRTRGFASTPWTLATWRRPCTRRRCPRTIPRSWPGRRTGPPCSCTWPRPTPRASTASGSRQRRSRCTARSRRVRSDVRFELPPTLEAAAPPEARGLRRDGVRLLVIDRGTGAVRHSRFSDLPRLLGPGDLLVANDSRTLPASLTGWTATGARLELRLAGRDGERWAALALGVPARGDPALVPTDARPPAPELVPGERLTFAGGLEARVLGRHEEVPAMVWVSFDRCCARLLEALHRAGQPVRYAYVPERWALHHYQTLFAAAPGSAEMPSAGRPFTVQTLHELRARGVGLATISLHAGLSTYGDPEVDRRFVAAEPYRVPEATAAAVAQCHAAGGRVIAIGTTVVRTLETAADPSGQVRPGAGVTRLRIDPDHQLRAVDGLLTGLHEPEASHLDLLRAFLSSATLRAAYDEALREGYLWHEFGDVCLIADDRN